MATTKSSKPNRTTRASAVRRRGTETTTLEGFNMATAKNKQQESKASVPAPAPAPAADRDTKVNIKAKDGAVVVSVSHRDAKTGEMKLVGTDSFPINALKPLAGQLAVFGFQKLLRNATLRKEPKAKLEAMRDVYERLSNGDDTVLKPASRRAQTPRGVRIEVEALARLQNTTVAAIQSVLKGYDKDQVERILSNDKVQEMVEELREEQQGSDVSLDDYLED